MSVPRIKRTPRFEVICGLVDKGEESEVEIVVEVVELRPVVEGSVVVFGFFGFILIHSNSLHKDFMIKRSSDDII